MNKKFEIVVTSLTDRKMQQTASSLFAKYKPTIAKELERANGLAFELYFKNFIKESLLICEILEEEKFNGNYNLWTWIQSGLLLKCWICKNENEVVQKIMETINATLSFGDDEVKKNINKRARDRRLNGSLLHYDKIQQTIQENDEKSELTWREGQFKELLFIYFLGGSESIPTDKALDELNDNEKRIKQLYQ